MAKLSEMGLDSTQLKSAHIYPMLCKYIIIYSWTFEDEGVLLLPMLRLGI